MKLTFAILAIALAIVYFVDFIVLFKSNDKRWWRSLIMSAVCSGATILILRSFP